jgi:hypothetical protein
MTTYVGFVSLGNRGLPMAQHLRKASYALHVLTRTAADDAKSRETDAKQGEGSWLRERPAIPSHRHAALSLLFSNMRGGPHLMGLEGGI